VRRRCRLTPSKPVLKASMVSALEAKKMLNCFQILLSNSTCAATAWYTVSAEAGLPKAMHSLGRGLHSSTFQLNPSRI